MFVPTPNSDLWATVAATCPATDPDEAAEPEPDPKLRALLERINGIAGTRPPEVGAQDTEPEEDSTSEDFTPPEPTSFWEAGVTESQVESLILKFLLPRGDAAGRAVADQIRLPFVLVDELLRRMKYEQLLAYRDSAPMSDYVYQLTDLGRERARRLAEHCTYFGATPVSLEDYIKSVKAQSLQNQHPTRADLRRAFQDLLISEQMLDRLGPAINSARGLFLHGAPGNGKTSIAERVTRAFGKSIWIPRAITVDGEIIRLFDPMNHQELPLTRGEGLLDDAKIDKRWVRIKRPTIAVGGELTMANLEVAFHTTMGICEAPLQLKSNCGTLVIDDFGRQRMSTDELLNRWIVPLEKRYDFLNMPNGKKIEVPFDQLIVFSTNLQPKDLVDEAFCDASLTRSKSSTRRKPEFRQLFRLECPKMGVEYDKRAIDYLIEKHYKLVDRPFRSCQPRDMLLQVRNHCLYQNKPLSLSPEHFDFAVSNYFAVL